MGARLTAVVLSPSPVELQLPGLEVLNHVAQFADHWGMNKARREALEKVQTEFWFYLDSDDSLPSDYLEILTECVQQNSAITYTDYLLKRKEQEDFVYRPGEYSQTRHASNMYLLHHSVICRTADSLEIVKTLPSDTIALFEFMLYFKLAERSVSYVPKIGYHWHKSDGFHTKPDAVRAVVTAAIWCNRNMKA